MIKVGVVAPEASDVTLRGFLETQANPSKDLSFLVVEFELTVLEEPTSEMLFDALNPGSIFSMSIGGAPYKDWEYIYRNSNGFLFRQKFNQPI
ncbi:hypothetical protein ABEH00_09960 [Pantoea agglomerans]|uniref:hypothetical protein n=1 Tax=Enterobacter agglomerans TaxID=549 RepID=UPI00165423E1|nr:hypothetical protein [Pantoea agglomerans]MBD8157231.1 hypothetical protein [Pantoea agglomerans]MBD8234639.1 hypothetical protein [Pantoea agglomerans]